MYLTCKCFYLLHCVFKQCRCKSIRKQTRNSQIICEVTHKKSHNTIISVCCISCLISYQCYLCDIGILLQNFLQIVENFQKYFWLSNSEVFHYCLFTKVCDPFVDSTLNVYEKGPKAISVQYGYYGWLVRQDILTKLSSSTA